MKPRVPTIVTELGLERLCRGCGEFWPADPEFWFFTTNRHGKRQVMGRCKACWSERIVTPDGRRVQGRMAVPA
jgi:hypothetical protein